VTRTRRIPAPRERDGDSDYGLVFAYGLAMKFQVRDVAGPVVDAEPTPYWLTFQIRFAVDGSGVAAA
jgi:hypothetical protein